MSADVIVFPAQRPTRRRFTGGDQLPALVDEYFRIVDEVNAPGISQEHFDQVFEQGEAAVQRVVDMVPPTAAGILAQLRLLRHITGLDRGGDGDDGNWCDDRDFRLFDSIAAGVERLAAGGADRGSTAPAAIEKSATCSNPFLAL
jgi:hypothetical protein